MQDSYFAYRALLRRGSDARSARAPSVPDLAPGVHGCSDELTACTELYRTPLPVYEVAHGTPDTPAGWSVRLPAYEGAGLAAEILDRDGRVVFTQDLARVEL